MTEPLPVEITIGDQTETHYIEGFEIDHARNSIAHPIKLRLDNGEINVGKDMGKPILNAMEECADD